MIPRQTTSVFRILYMKIVFISSLLPTGHYSENLLKALQHNTDLDIITYTDRNRENTSVKNCGTIIPVWRKNVFFIVDILRQIRKDKPDIVHLQHEFTMYGGILTALLVPILVLILRLQGYKVVTTLHAVVARDQIDDTFIDTFMIHRKVYMRPIVFKLIFAYIYTIVGRYSHILICHTNILRQHLIADYGVPEEKAIAIPPVIPPKKILQVPTEPYFLYFGYMVRRKGIEYVLRGLQSVVKQYPKFKLVMAGGTIPGQEQAFAELKKQIHDLRLEKNVEIKGFIEHESILDELYAKAYAVVIPARLSIAASGPLYHARGYNKCILASDIGNFKEEVQHMKDGILVDNNRWAEALTEIIENTQLVKTLEQRSAQKAHQHSPQNIGKEYSHCYNNLYLNA